MTEFTVLYPSIQLSYFTRWASNGAWLVILAVYPSIQRPTVHDFSCRGRATAHPPTAAHPWVPHRGRSLDALTNEPATATSSWSCASVLCGWFANETSAQAKFLIFVGTYNSPCFQHYSRRPRLVTSPNFLCDYMWSQTCVLIFDHMPLRSRHVKTWMIQKTAKSSDKLCKKQVECASQMLCG